jgi:omega-6 fatty acid desaturase (delta-12 desaturase)
MTKSDNIAVPAEDASKWIRNLGSYREPKTSRGIFEIVVTIVPFVALWTLTWMALSVGYWLSLLLAVPTAGFLVRLFMIQHDCGHGAFFRRRLANDWVGRVIGVMTLTPYHCWRRTHATHHAAVGNLDRRGVGDVETLTVKEYLALPSRRRLVYRIFRNPIVMFGLVPAYLFLFHYRLPVGLMHAGIQPWLSAMTTNVAIAAVVAAMMALIGPWPFLLVHGPVMLISASIGVWFFFVQHQFEDTRWSHDDAWSFPEAALHGSSHYELPPVLAWFTGNIGVHHVHHLCSRIPFYRLPQVLDDHPELSSVGRLTFLQGFRCATLALWDEEERRLVPFRELRKRRRRPSPGHGRTEPRRCEKRSDRDGGNIQQEHLRQS